MANTQQPQKQPTPNPTPSNNKGNHPIVETDDKLSKSGRSMGGPPNAPLVSVHETSIPSGKAEKKNYKTVSNAFDNLLGDEFSPEYDGVMKLDVEGGLFVPIEPNQTIDQLMFNAYAQVDRLNQYYSVPAHNEKGEEILDQVAIKEFKRNDDKTIQLDGMDKPITGANQTHLLRRIQLRQYIAINVTKNKQFDSDGALIIRVF